MERDRVRGEGTGQSKRETDRTDETDRQANQAINPAIANGDSPKWIRHTEESDENGRGEKMGKSYRHTIE